MKTENCFRCGDVDHWSRECPRKESVCAWCDGIGHIEKTRYSKKMEHQGVEKQEHEVVVAEVVKVELTEERGVMEGMEKGTRRNMVMLKCWLER